MSELSSGKRRARAQDDRQERKSTILNAARGLLGPLSLADLTMDHIARSCDLAKSTLYLYFSTRESLFLALLEDELTGWFDQVDKRLSLSRGRWSPSKTALELCKSLDGRPMLPPLLSILEPVLERNIDEGTLLNFKSQLLTRMTTTGGLLESRLGLSQPSDGIRLLLHFRALLNGLYQMSENSPILAGVIAQEPRLRAFQIEFREQLLDATTKLIRGWLGGTTTKGV